MTAIRHSSLVPFTLCAYHEADHATASALGTPVIDWWHAKGPKAALHLVAVVAETGEIVGHLQAMDAGVPLPSRRPGQCHFTLDVAPSHRRQGIGGALYVQAEASARRRAARLLYTAYRETEDAPAATFLTKRGFEPLERYYPSSLDLTTFEPLRFASAVEKVCAQGIRLQTYADVGDSVQHRRKLYELEQCAHATQPFLEVEPYIPAPYDLWEQDFLKRDPTTLFLALTLPEAAWVGVVTGLEWYFTGSILCGEDRGLPRR